MLYQIAVSHTFPLGICQQGFHQMQLMVPGENLFVCLTPCKLVLFLSELDIVLDDAGKILLGQDTLPKIGRLQSVRIRRIARTFLVALIKGQEP